MKQVRNRSWWGRKFNPQERAWIRLEDWFFFLCKGYFLNEHSLPGDGKSQTDTRVRLIYFLKTNGEVRKAHVLFLSKTSIGLGCYFNALSVDRHQSESTSERAWKWPDTQEQADGVSWATPQRFLSLRCLLSAFIALRADAACFSPPAK